MTLGQEALKELGVDPFRAHRLSLLFNKKEKEMMPELYALRCEEESYISNYRKQHENLEKLMELDSNEKIEAIDKAWTAKNPEI